MPVPDHGRSLGQAALDHPVRRVVGAVVAGVHPPVHLLVDGAVAGSGSSPRPCTRRSRCTGTSRCAEAGLATVSRAAAPTATSRVQQSRRVAIHEVASLPRWQAPCRRFASEITTETPAPSVPRFDLPGYTGRSRGRSTPGWVPTERRWQDAAHAWNQPHPRRGRRPRRPPRRHVVRHRPRPHDRRHDLRLDHHDPLHLHASPAPRPSPTSSARPSTRSRSTATPSTPRRRTPTAGSRSPAWPPTTSWSSAPTAPTRHTGEGLHRFVDPADDRVYLYSQFEVPDARRVFTTLRAARPQGAVHVQRDRADALEGRLQRPDARRPTRGRRAARRSGTSRRPSRCRPTSPRSSPASTTRCCDTYQGKHGDIPLGHYCRQSLVEHLDVDELVELTKQGFEFFEEAFDFPYPFGKYDQLYVPEYNMGAMENAGCVTLRDEYLPRSRQDALVLRVPRLGDPPRDGAHVVRRPRHHEVVGRPLAQRVVRRVGLLPRRGRGHRVHRRLDRLRQRPQELGLPPGPAAHHPPDRGRQRRPARRRGQLRRDHLRQGRLGAQAARRLGRARAVPRRPAAATSRTTRTATPSSPTCSAALEKSSGRELERWAQEWLQTVGRQHARARLRARRRRQLRVVRGRADRAPGLPDPAPAPARHRPVRRAWTAAWCAATSVEIDVEGDDTEVARAGRPEAARPAAAQRRRPHLRQDPPRRALARHRRSAASPASTTRWPARCAGARRGT